ncbi:hypothetical protein D9758_015029 [Tetrapyrgos nigripes]|uniref:RNA-directed DNA polymerase n=1 Tax=Tetrapyrgos nigripes TaxID=182062 RepID=A0A8H5CDV6_9AGAR|nr:hypothetical protein D9758_015029 [Tetrapyrgos nigripes]
MSGQGTEWSYYDQQPAHVDPNTGAETHYAQVDPNSPASISHAEYIQLSQMVGVVKDLQDFQTTTLASLSQLHKFQTDTSATLASIADSVSQILAQGTGQPPQPPPTSQPTASSSRGKDPVRPSSPPPSSSYKPPSFTPPTPFKGKATDVETFIDSVQDAVELLGRTLTTDRQKCIYMATLFAEAPKQWYRAIRTSKPELLDSFTDFITSFRAHFGESNIAYVANNKLKKLVQTGSAASYASRFLELLVHVNWTDETKIDMFYSGLKTATKDLISNTPRSERPKTFLDYSQWVITCDNRVHEREQERRDEGGKKTSNGMSSKPSSSKSHSSTNPTPSTSNTLPLGEPMQIDASKTGVVQGKLTSEERQRRKDQGLCLYCGRCGKQADECPNRSEQAIKRMAQRKAGFPVGEGVHPSHVNQRPEPRFERTTDGSWRPISTHSPTYIFSSRVIPSAHFVISITLSFTDHTSIRTHALIDSGAMTSCISDSFASRHSLSRRLKDVPVPVLAVDDRPIASGLITQDVLTQIRVGSHQETINLSVVSVSYPVILGLDWLHVVVSLLRRFFAKGLGLMPSQSLNTVRVGLGLGLLVTPLLSSRTLSSQDPSSIPSIPSVVPSNSYSDIPVDSKHHSFLAAFVHHNGYGNSCSTRFVSPISFDPSRKAVKYLIFVFFDQDSTYYINSFTVPPSSHNSSDSTSSTLSSTIPPPAPTSVVAHNPLADPDEDLSPYVPLHYRKWLDSVFKISDFDGLPEHRPHDIDIELEDGKSPPFYRMYRLSEQEKQATAEYVHNNLRRGHIRSSSSSAGAPILFIRKKTGEICLCVDYRGLNAITKKNRYPLPLVDDLLDRVSGCSVFSIMDLKSAYAHLRIREGDEWKTAFRTHLGLFEHLVVPYGLTNAPAAWQAFIQDVLSDLIDICCVVYLDDILVFSTSEEEHHRHVGMVLDRLRDAFLYANPRKCEFDHESQEAFDSTLKELQSFLGFANFYRRFVKDYSRITLPLTSLTHKSTPFIFSDTCINAFNHLKSLFTSAPVLSHFQPSLPITLSTDASDFAISSVLQQPDSDGNLHPVAFFSCKLSPAEINYAIHDKELLAVVEAFKENRHWLSGSPFPIRVVCDHKNLEYFMRSQLLNRRQARWSMFLSEFDFQLHWASGKENVADSASRRADYVPQKEDEQRTNQLRIVLSTYNTFPLFNFESISSFESPSSQFKSTIDAFSTITLDNSYLLDRFLTAYREDSSWRIAIAHGDQSFQLHHDLVFHNHRLYVPPSLRRSILESRHDSVISGHPGRTRTLKLVSRDYSWPGMTTYVRRYVEACDTCSRIKTPRHKPFGLLQPLSIPERPWQAITMDFIVKLPLSHGYDSILVICDRLTRAAHFIPCRESMTASELAWLFLDRVFRLHGLPHSIVSDRGSLFVSNFWKSLLSHLNIDSRTSMAYHAQMDGLTERTNQTLEAYLRAYISYQQDDWIDYLPLAEFAFNNHENSSTRQTPFFANLAYHPTFEPSISSISTVPAADDLAKRLEFIHAELKAELLSSQERQAKYYDARHIAQPQYQSGQLVWLLRRNISSTRPSDKLDHRRLGPFPIVRAIHNRAYLLKLPSYLSRLYPVFHVSLLEPYNDPSEFHPHSDPVPITLPDDSSSIHSILDIRKIGQRYDYLCHFNDSDSHDNDSWIPLSELPSTYNHLIERFHRLNPRAPHPHELLIDKTYDTTMIQTDSDSIIPTSDTPSTSVSIPDFVPRPSSPKQKTVKPHLDYVPPTHYITRSNRRSKPKPRDDTIIFF